MQHFKFYDFLNVEVCALKCIDDEATRDEAWEKNCKGFANSLSVMVEEAFEEG